MKSNLIVSIASIVLLAQLTCTAATFNLTNPDVEVTTSHPNDTSIGVSFTGSWTDSPAFTVQSGNWSFGINLLEVGSDIQPDGAMFANWALQIISPQYGTFERVFNLCNLGNGGWVVEQVNGSFLFRMRINDFAFNTTERTYRGNISGEERNAPEPTGWLAPLLSLVLVAVGKHRRR